MAGVEKVAEIRGSHIVSRQTTLVCVGDREWAAVTTCVRWSSRYSRGRSMLHATRGCGVHGGKHGKAAGNPFNGRGSRAMPSKGQGQLSKQRARAVDDSSAWWQRHLFQEAAQLVATQEMGWQKDLRTKNYGMLA